jgi:hypothetical protein
MEESLDRGGAGLLVGGWALSQRWLLVVAPLAAIAPRPIDHAAWSIGRKTLFLPSDARS